MPAEPFSGFPADTIKFLNELKQHNDRDWFNERKSRYEEVYAEPAIRFIAAMQKPLKSVSPFLQAIPKKQGGSLLRIYRDTRFSPDKTPYKTHIGIQFRHEAGKSIHAPGVYLHIEPQNVFVAVGIWRPEKDPLLWIRQAIVEDPQSWKKVRDQKRFRDTFNLQGDSLKRPPRGFEADHEMIEDIKRKDFIGVAQLDENLVHQPDFPRLLTIEIKKASVFMGFLCEALELPY